MGDNPHAQGVRRDGNSAPDSSDANESQHCSVEFERCWDRNTGDPFSGYGLEPRQLLGDR